MQLCFVTDAGLGSSRHRQTHHSCRLNDQLCTEELCFGQCRAIGAPSASFKRQASCCQKTVSSVAPLSNSPTSGSGYRQMYVLETDASAHTLCPAGGQHLVENRAGLSCRPACPCPIYFPQFTCTLVSMLSMQQILHVWSTQPSPVLSPSVLLAHALPPYGKRVGKLLSLSKERCWQVADLVKADRLNRLNRVCWDVAEQRAQRLGDRTLQVQPHRCCTAGDGQACCMRSIACSPCGGRDLVCAALQGCSSTLLDAYGIGQPQASVRVDPCPSCSHTMGCSASAQPGTNVAPTTRSLPSYPRLASDLVSATLLSPYQAMGWLTANTGYAGVGGGR